MIENSCNIRYNINGFDNTVILGEARNQILSFWAKQRIKYCHFGRSEESNTVILSEAKNLFWIKYIFIRETKGGKRL